MSTTWTFGPNGVYTASWSPGPPTPVLTVTLTASGALLETCTGDVPSQALAQAAVNALATTTSTLPPSLGGTGQTGDPLPPFMASDEGLLAQNFDPGTCDTFTAPTTNVVNLIRVNIRQAMSITNVVLLSTTGGGSLTSGQNFAGLFSSAGTLLGTSADQTTPWASAGVKTMALAGGPFAVAAGFVWVGFVSNTGSTTPAFMRTGGLNAAAMNVGFAVATARWATNGTATTALATVTPSSSTLAGVGYWAGVS